MSDIQTNSKKKKKKDSVFEENFDTEYDHFKIGVLLKQARKESGLTQKELAFRLNTKRSAISRIENHAEDIKLSTLYKIVTEVPAQAPKTRERR